MTKSTKDEGNRVFWGWVLTALWAAGVAAYVALGVGVSDFLALDPNAVGDFFAGVFAPLAFLWLVIGYFQQGAELRENTKALADQVQEAKKAAEQAEIQAKALTTNTKLVTLSTFLQTSKLQERDLAHYAFQVMLRFPWKVEEFDSWQSQIWRTLGWVDEYSVFAQTTAYILDQRDRAEQFLKQSDGKLIREARRYNKVFENLLARADECDDGTASLRKGYEWSPMGHLYSELTKLGGIESHALRYAHRAFHENQKRS
jgi:hypothetical protein